MRHSEMIDKLRRMAALRPVMNDMAEGNVADDPTVAAEYRNLQEVIRPDLAGLVALMIEAGQLTVYLALTTEIHDAISDGVTAHLILDVVNSFPNGGIYLEPGEIVGSD